MCPSSNVATRAVASLEEHPLRAFRDAGVAVTVNSDDPPMFGTTLNREYEIAAELLDLDEAGLADWLGPAVRRRSLRTTWRPGCWRRSSLAGHVAGHR